MRINIIAFFIIFPTLLYSQRKSDLGLCLGTAYYMGDVNPILPFSSPGINLGVVYRYNFNIRYVLKLEANYMKLGANDANFTDYFQLARNLSFNFPAYDFASQFEFNFLPLKFAEGKKYFTPFVSAGLGFMAVLGGTTTSKLNIPMAVGCRMSLGKYYSVGLEWNLRKLFSDQLDGQLNIGSNGRSNPIFNNDWYYFAGIIFSVRLFANQNDCPAYK